MTVQVLSSAQVVGAAAPVPTAGTTILGVELADEARARQDAELLPGSDSFVQVVMGATAGCGERATMISADRRHADPGCSPHRAVGTTRWWVHSTGVNSVERSSTDLPYQTLACQDDVLAGQRRCPGNFDTEEVTGSIPVSPTSKSFQPDVLFWASGCLRPGRI